MQTLKNRRSLFTVLDALHFRAAGDATYRLNGLVARPQRRWCVLEQRAKPGTNPLTDARGRPGLWKIVTDGPSELAHQEFQFPLAAARNACQAEDGEGQNPLEQCVQWAMDTARGELPGGWEPPTLATVESWICDGGLSLQCGPFVRQGTVVCQPGRLAIQFPVVHELPQDLPVARTNWLHTVLIDAQNRWRLVRVGLGASADRPAVVAEVDLSGSPQSILEELFKISVDTLRWVVSWLVWPVAFLADPSVVCTAWELCQPSELFMKGASG